MPSTILLRDVITDDLPIFFEYQRDPVAVQMAAFPARDRETFMAHWAKIMADETNILKTILCDGQVAGNIVSWDQSGEHSEHSEREVGYWLGREFWGKGLATQALAAFLDLDTTRPLYAYVVKHNLASQRVLEKCGFEPLDEKDEDVILILR